MVDSVREVDPYLVLIVLHMVKWLTSLVREGQIEDY